MENIITRYEYDHLKEGEKYKFLLENEIYVRPKLLTDELENKLFKDDYRVKIKNKWWLDKHYDINPLIVEDIISKFFQLDIDISTTKGKIDNELEYTLNKEEVLDKYFKEYNNSINKNDVYLSAFYQKGELNNKKLKKLIRNHFKSSECHCIDLNTIEEYIVGDLNLYSIEIFKKLIDSISAMNVLKYLKRKLLIETQNNKKKEIILKNSNNEIFNGEEKEKLFYFILKKTGVQGNKGDLKQKRVQPYFDAIWEVHFNNKIEEHIEHKDNHKSFFKSIYSKMDYIIFLRNELKVNINKDNKLSSGTKYIDDVHRIIEEFYKELKKN
jgi:hypothetical protein